MHRAGRPWVRKALSHPMGTFVRMASGAAAQSEYVVVTDVDSLIPSSATDGLALMQAGIGRLFLTDIDTHHLQTALEMITEFEVVSRQVDAFKAEVLASIDRTGVHALDGHRTAKAMVAHNAQLSNAEVERRRKAARVLDALPLLRERYLGGWISSSMVDKLGRLYSNRRIRDLMVDADAWFVEHAENDTYELFDLVVSQWAELADQDGAESKDKRHERDRNHVMVQDADGKWHWDGSAAAYDGAKMNDVFVAFERIEFDIDWQWVLDTHGDDANASLMPRTAAQRRADAFAKVHEYAAKALKAETGHEITTDVTIDGETFEREARRLMGEDPDDSMGPVDPTRDDFVCATMTGSRVPSRRAVAEALLGYLRRNVIGADSVTIDLGRRRLFTGYARLAAQLSASECYWPGCHVNVSACQIDHLTPHSTRDGPGGPDPGGGLTNPHNGAPCCGHHNRHKERGYTVTRLADGTIEIRRPDGTILN